MAALCLSTREAASKSSRASAQQPSWARLFPLRSHCPKSTGSAAISSVRSRIARDHSPACSASRASRFGSWSTNVPIVIGTAVGDDRGPLPGQADRVQGPEHLLEVPELDSAPSVGHRQQGPVRAEGQVVLVDVGVWVLEQHILLAGIGTDESDHTVGRVNGKERAVGVKCHRAGALAWRLAQEFPRPNLPEPDSVVHARREQPLVGAEEGASLITLLTPDEMPVLQVPDLNRRSLPGTGYQPATVGADLQVAEIWDPWMTLLGVDPSRSSMITSPRNRSLHARNRPFGPHATRLDCVVAEVW